MNISLFTGEVSDIYPDYIQKVLFDHSYEHLDKLKQHANSVCKGAINPKYIERAFQLFMGGYAYYDNDILIGFILWDIDIAMANPNDVKYKSSNVNECLTNTNEKLHILLVCSNQSDVKLGSLMLYDTEKYAISQGIYFVYLEASHSGLIKYYEIHGYTLLTDVHTNIRMCKYIKPVKIRRRARNGTRRISKKEKANRARAALKEPNLGIL